MHGLQWSVVVAAVFDWRDVVCAGTHGVWCFERFVYWLVAPCACEVVAGEGFGAVAAVCVV